MDYQIKPTIIDGLDADGVYENRDGAWIGEVTFEGPDGPAKVMPYSDEGAYIPAPANWRELILRAL